ncbi:serine/threonine/tyrosine-interacting-like protein 1 [Patella vulgata]|uniref:serine/threonine/tyrosine-interacting-like protein 1 n=1 Tax=Patella vulgata TaxID=6465 RepID=UPI00218095C1|nr:serine/threonine/tyrosine-interacting-like protein 1 [Patella vulgata]
MDGLRLLEPCDLYNMLQQATVYSCLSDPNYLLLMDARKKHEYNESHIITAKKAPKNEDGEFMIPYDAELECKQTIVVYDSNTESPKQEAPATDYSKLLWEMGSRNKVYILKGGYEDFSALYPFLRTQKIMYMPRELDDLKPYPTEIIPGFLYLGNWRQGNAPYIQKDLKIKGHINCVVEAETFFPESGPFLYHIQVEDTNDADIYSHFAAACAFLDTHRESRKAVLVFSNLGISRSVTVVVAYLMYHNKWTLQEAYDRVLKCCTNIRPNRGFIEQLSNWEVELFDTKKTDISDPNF